MRKGECYRISPSIAPCVCLYRVPHTVLLVSAAKRLLPGGGPTTSNQPFHSVFLPCFFDSREWDSAILEAERAVFESTIFENRANAALNAAN